MSHGLLPQYGIFSLGFSCLHNDFPSHSYCKRLNILSINYELFFFSKSLPLLILYFSFVFVYFAYAWHNPPFYVFELCYLENYFSLHLYKRLLTKFAYICSLGQSVYILHAFT